MQKIISNDFGILNDISHQMFWNFILVKNFLKKYIYSDIENIKLKINTIRQKKRTLITSESKNTQLRKETTLDGNNSVKVDKLH